MKEEFENLESADIGAAEQDDLKSGDNQKEIDYSVYNTLNLMAPTLGESYVADGYNPFPEGYTASEDDISEILKKKKECKKIEASPDFIENGVSSSKHSFKTALQNTTLLKEEMIKKMINSDVLSKKQCEKVVLYLKNREQLLKKFLTKINRGANILEMLQELTDLDPELAEKLKSTFYKNFNLQIALDNLVRFIMQEMEKHPIKTELEKPQETIKEISVAELAADTAKKTAENFVESLDNVAKVATTLVKEAAEVVKPTIERKVEKTLQSTLTEVKTDKKGVQNKIVENKVTNKLDDIKSQIKTDHKKVYTKTDRTFDDDGMSL